MSSSVLVVSIVLACCLAAGLFYIVKSGDIERSRRQDKTSRLIQHENQLRYLMGYIPAAYMAREVQLVLLQEIVSTLGKILQLNPMDPSAQKRLAHEQEALKTLANSAPPQQRSHAFNSDKEAMEIRRDLARLHNYVVSLAQRKALTTAAANNCIACIRHDSVRVALDHFMAKAYAAKNIGKPEMSTLFMQRALDELRKQPDPVFWQKQMEQLNASIADIKRKLAAASHKEGETLAKEMDQIKQSSDSWKKQYF